MIEEKVLDNPLLEGLALDRHVDSLSFVIFGAHGDLTKRN
jgi:hypothetical protein